MKTLIAETPPVTLTPREQEILACIAEGLSSKQIASKLFISENTVANHRKNMLLKTGSQSSAQLVRNNISNYAR
jgi:DNA-binding CsgD family transcriptional regulator